MNFFITHIISKYEEIYKFFIVHIINKYEEIFLYKTSQKDINIKWYTICKGCDRWVTFRHYELFWMDKVTIMKLCDRLKRHENLQGTWLVTVGKTIVMFLLIVGYNVRIRIVAYHFQHSIEIIA